MKGIRGLLEKDFRLFRYQGGRFFLVIGLIALFFSLSGGMGAGFVTIYVSSVLAIYGGSTISYDEVGHGFEYLFSLPVSRKVYVKEKYIFSLIMTVCGWVIGMICTGIAVLAKREVYYDKDMLLESLVSLLVIMAVAGIMIAIRLRFEGEKGRLVFPIVFLAVFAVIYFSIDFVKSYPAIEETLGRMMSGIGDFGMITGVVAVSVVVLLISYGYSMKVIKEKEF